MRQTLFLFGLILLAQFKVSNVMAYDFEVNGIYYTVTSFEDFTVGVDGLSESISGTIELPSTIIYNNKIFSVTSIITVHSSRIESVIIPASILEIGDGAFARSSIQSIVIPDNVTTIGNNAFYGCTKLYNVKISKNVTSLAYALFEGCTLLTEIDWHPECTNGNIYGRCFYDCTSLKTFRLPKGIYLNGSIDTYGSTTIFKNCTLLDSLIIEDGEGTIRFAYYKSSSESSHGEFKGSKINYVYLGRAIEEYKQSPDLRYVEHLEIGDKVTELPYWLPNLQNYSNANHLKTLVIGSSLTKVRDFSNDFNWDGTSGNQTLEYIKIKRTTPPEAIGFSNYNFINTILYVPKGAKATYESAEIWKNFWNIQEYSDDGSEVGERKCANPTISYSNGKLSFSCQTDGATCQSTITDTDIKSYNVNEIELGVTYIVNVYATKPGYENSEVVTATLCWLNAEPKTEGTSNDVASARGSAVLIQSKNGVINVSGVEDGANVSIYTAAGVMAGSAIVCGNHASVATNIPSGELAIVRIGEKSVKIMTQ